MSPLARALIALSISFSCACGEEAAPSDAETGGASTGGLTSSGGQTSPDGGSASDGDGGTESGSGGAGGGSVGGDGGTTSSGGSTASGGRAPSGGSTGDGGEHTSGGDGQGGTGRGATGPGGGGNAVPSVGCGTAPGLVSGLTSLDVDGTEREYILDLPETYDPSYAYRLIFGFHGLQYDAEWVAEGEEPLTGPYFGMQELAQDTAIFIAPQALSGGWSNQDGRDIDFVVAMLSRLEAELCVDLSRTFASGFSFGGIMTVRIGCELSGEFRAIAPMSASLQGSCADSEPLAYLSTHGLSDTTISPGQGEEVRDLFLERNGCDVAPSAADEDGCVSYSSCAAGAPVSWCTFEGVHEPAPYAGRVLWDFFSQF